MKKSILLFILSCATGVQLMAQRGFGTAAARVSSTSTGIGTSYYVAKEEAPRAIEFAERTVTTTRFLAGVNAYFDIPLEFTFIEEESNTDRLGIRHRYLQQYYKGIPVEGMGYRVHEKDGFVRSANGRAVRTIQNLNTQVILTEEAAFQRAVQFLNSKDTVFRHGKKLVVSKNFAFTPQSFSVAYQFDIAVSMIEQWRISIDARTGLPVNKVSLVNSCGTGSEPPLPYGTGTGMTNYYGTQTIRVEQMGESSRLQGQTENGGIIATYDYRHASAFALLFGVYDRFYDFYSPGVTYNDPYQKPAVSVQWAAEQAYEYYFKRHNRNSFDNNGSAIKSYVHVDNGLNNAFWLGGYKMLAFGDGINNNPLVELDVVSHELTHGVTQHEAGLQYTDEPGSLNESFSDILGKAIEFYTFGDSATWQLGNRNQHGGMRDFSNPNLRGQPDTYFGDMWYTGIEDNGGVHTNSGVQNFWFYLLCEGGTGVNDHDANYSITPIGMVAAANIVYRNLTEYLGPQSDYLDSRIGSLLATADLYGKNSAIYQQVDKAWDAVGVIDEPIITSLEVYDITATTAMLRGSLVPRGDTVSYQFEYGTTPAFENSLQFHEYTGTVSGMMTELLSETKYYVRLVATNENGESYATAEFTTISLAPLVKIKPTVDVTETTAVFYGEVNPNSLPTSYYFEYGPTPTLGLVTPTYGLPESTNYQDVSASVTDLQPRQTYYYKLVAVNSFATSETDILTLFTAAKPVISSFTPGTAPIDTEITITGQNFNASAEKNLVNFGATRALVLSATSTEMKVKVPAGASLGPISILDAESGLAAESVQEFVPTFSGEFDKNSLQLTVGQLDNIYDALVQDMDADGRPDIVVRHYLGFSVYLNVNIGGDVTEASFVRSTFNSDTTPSFVFLVDLDGNGLKDVVTGYSNVLRIYPNLSAAGYVFFGAPVDVPIGEFGDFVFADFDQDGHIDIGGRGTNEGVYTITVIRNKNPRGVIAASNFSKDYTRVSPYFSQLSVSDVDNNGAPDLILAKLDTDFVSILTNHSHPGTFDFQEKIISDPTRGRLAYYVASDLNQDGWKDLISLSRTPFEDFQASMLSILENSELPDLTLGSPALIQNGTKERTVQPGDLNGDGKVDLIVGLDNRVFVFLQSNVEPNESFTGTSFEKFSERGDMVTNTGSGRVESDFTINDLNGDGRPEVIRTNSYSYGPHDGFNLEIWQNGGVDCLDPSEVTFDVSYNTVEIVLPPNTTFDQYEIEYTRSNFINWQKVWSTTLDNLWQGQEYQIRVRAKCYMGFTDYHYFTFTPECVDANSFAITDVGVDNVTIQAYNLFDFEVQYSHAGSGQWETLPRYRNEITGLSHGTAYDLRFRGRCAPAGEFRYMQFTTLCPTLSSLMVTDVTANSALVKWKTSYSGGIILEYSADNVTWTMTDGINELSPLLPSTQYFVRGKLMCNGGASDYSYVSFTTTCPEVSMLSVDNITPFSATLNWVDENATGQYTVTWSATTGGETIVADVNSTSFSIDGLETGTEYTVSIAPRCTGDEKHTSTTFSTVCYVPIDLSVDAVTHTTAELSWNDQYGERPYTVDYFILDGGAGQTIGTSSMNAFLSDLRPGTEYEARVHITCSTQPEPYISLQFTTDLYGKTMFAPNPTQREVTIYPSTNLIGRHFKIYDNTGRKVADAELLDYTIDLSKFPPSIYLLTIDGENPVKIVKY